MPSFGDYNATEVAVNFAAIDIDDMRADEFVRWEPAEDAFMTIMGSDGSITRVASNNTLYNITITLKRSSKANALLSAIHASDLIVKGGSGVASFIVKDLNGSTLFACEKAWIKAMPPAGHSKEVGPDCVWALQGQVLPGQNIVGGNQL